MYLLTFETRWWETHVIEDMDNKAVILHTCSKGLTRILSPETPVLFTWAKVMSYNLADLTIGRMDYLCSGWVGGNGNLPYRNLSYPFAFYLFIHVLDSEFQFCEKVLSNSTEEITIRNPGKKYVNLFCRIIFSLNKIKAFHEEEYHFVKIRNAGRNACQWSIFSSWMYEKYSAKIYF